MSLLVVGSIAFDSVQTPYGAVENAIGGSAIYFSYAASFFSRVRLCGVAGSDFPAEQLDKLREKGVDLEGLQQVEGPTFRWAGKYEGAMNSAETIETQLNVYGKFKPELPQSYKDTKFAFLANGPTDIQHGIIDQLSPDCFIVADTMNLWIDTTRPLVLRLLERVNGMLLNDAEARMLSGETNLVKACRWVRDHGPDYVIVKKGEHGAISLGPDGFTLMPAFPTDAVCDPTGAGDSFAGAFMGKLAADGTVTKKNIETAMACATVMASFAIEDFSLRRLESLSKAEIDARLKAFTSSLPALGVG